MIVSNTPDKNTNNHNPTVTTKTTNAFIHPKAPNTTRIIFQNLNGIPYINLKHNWINMLAEFKDLDEDMFTCCEHNLQINRKTKNQIYEATRKVKSIKMSKTILADNPLQTSTDFKPGGTAQVITNELVGRIATAVKDKIGQWTHTTFNSQANPITIYSAYAPTASIPTTARATNTMQQRVFFEQEALKKQRHQGIRRHY